ALETDYPMVRIYEKLGFKVIKEVKSKEAPDNRKKSIYILSADRRRLEGIMSSMMFQNLVTDVAFVNLRDEYPWEPKFFLSPEQLKELSELHPESPRMILHESGRHLIDCSALLATLGMPFFKSLESPPPNL